MENAGQKRFPDFDLAGGAFIVTGGARGLGLAMAEALIEAGGKASLNASIESISAENRRLDGLIAAAGIVKTLPATDCTVEDTSHIMDINFTGLFMTATAAAREMNRYKCRGRICLVASMSGVIANKGMTSAVYNSSKAGVIQLTRSLAMEWTAVRADGSGGIRVNSISPGHVMTPMVKDLFENSPKTQEIWKSENMAHRLATPAEFKRGGALSPQ
ncbi:hypothetical protein KC342_g16034 [Hortaea werneckii]|nr:hypothetical protein KC342_g16034 [Hortaea werneckii]